MTTDLISIGEGLAARVRDGSGESVLWFHGYTLDSSAWEDVWDELAGWRHVGLDLPGHGASPGAEAGESLSALARRIGGWAVESDVRHLVGLSFGAIFTLQVAIEYPSAFETVVLGAPALAGGPQDSRVKSLYEEMLAMYRKEGEGEHLGAHWMNAPSPLFEHARARPVWPRLEGIIRRHDWGELRQGGLIRLLERPQRERELRRITARTLLLIGEHEMPAFRRCGELIRRSVPNCSREIVSGLGHLCMLEAPRMTAPLIDAHLRGTAH